MYCREFKIPRFSFKPWRWNHFFEKNRPPVGYSPSNRCILCESLLFVYPCSVTCREVVDISKICQKILKLLSHSSYRWSKLLSIFEPHLLIHQSRPNFNYTQYQGRHLVSHKKQRKLQKDIRTEVHAELRLRSSACSASYVLFNLVPGFLLI